MNKMKVMFEKYRSHAGLIILVCVAVYANMGMLHSAVRDYPKTKKTDIVSLYEDRMNKAREALAPYKEVGYVTTVDNEKIFGREKSFEDVEILAQYILAQYSLAPVIIRNSKEYQLVLGNFADGIPDSGYLMRSNLILVKDFGDGLILYKKGSRK
jgi:hypothetical protein